MARASGEAVDIAGRVAARYAALVDAGEVDEDPAQLALARRFDALDRQLGERRLARKSSPLGWLFARRATPIRGLYVHGPVGRGKTLLMDEFFAVAAPQRKRRAHFHEFMADVHERIHAFRQTVKDASRNADPITAVADGVAAETRLLCVDEFAVEDIADAMILSRLFARLFERGLVLVATSNSAPDDLYRDGLNRPLFLPFVALLKRHTDVIELAARTDYRLEKLGQAPVYVTPNGRGAEVVLDEAWLRLTGLPTGRPAAIAANGREIHVPQAAKGVARFDFAALCEAPLSAADYGRIARSFHTVMIDGVPVMAEVGRNTVRRFINLIDTFYDHGVKLVISADAEPDELYPVTDGREAFAFRRTASRLMEMRTTEYLSAPRSAFRRRDGAQQ